MVEVSRAETIRVTLTDDELLRVVARFWPDDQELPDFEEDLRWEITGVDRSHSTGERDQFGKLLSRKGTGSGVEIRLVRKAAREPESDVRQEKRYGDSRDGYRAWAENKEQS